MEIGSNCRYTYILKILHFRISKWQKMGFLPYVDMIPTYLPTIMVTLGRNICKISNFERLVTLDASLNNPNADVCLQFNILALVSLYREYCPLQHLRYRRFLGFPCWAKKFKYLTSLMDPLDLGACLYFNILKRALASHFRLKPEKLPLECRRKHAWVGSL